MFRGRGCYDVNCSSFNTAQTKDGCEQHNMGGGGVLPYKRLLEMCRWVGLYFHNWIDYNGVTFSVELLESDHTFLGFLG